MGVTKVNSIRKLTGTDSGGYINQCVSSGLLASNIAINNITIMSFTGFRMLFFGVARKKESGYTIADRQKTSGYRGK